MLILIQGVMMYGLSALGVHILRVACPEVAMIVRIILPLLLEVELGAYLLL
jgi:hypothetical protein